MTFVYKLFSYSYIYYCQGTKEHGVEYALLCVPENASFNNNRSTLFANRNQKYNHEIDVESIVDLTIKF